MQRYFSFTADIEKFESSSELTFVDQHQRVSGKLDLDEGTGSVVVDSLVLVRGVQRSESYTARIFVPM